MIRRTLRRATIAYRRSPHLVGFWRASRFVLFNYATRQSAEASPLVCQLLDFCGEWRSVPQVRAELQTGDEQSIERLVKGLTARTMLQASTARPDPREQAMTALDAWNPEAGFFHAATKVVRFWSRAVAARHASAQAARSPMPRAVRRYRGKPVVSLPRPRARGDAFTRALLERRTWRRFSNAPVTMQQLSAILAYGAGVQYWVTNGGTRLPLKTAPSGGARHPIECYVLVQRIAGLRPGFYHYAGDRHVLERLRGPVAKPRVRKYMPQSEYFADACAVFFFTVVFARQLWRYPYARAYRAALAEAGHVCQTMLLTATWLGLAPFSLMGLADSLIEKDLGLDGITESVVYAAGVGHPPARGPRAPLDHGSLQIRRNRWLATAV